MEPHAAFGHYPRSFAELEHELRTPLASIMSISEILSDNPGLPETERQRFLDAMLTESSRLAALVEFLLRSDWLDRPMAEPAAG